MRPRRDLTAPLTVDAAAPPPLADAPPAVAVTTTPPPVAIAPDAGVAARGALPNDDRDGTLDPFAHP